MPLLEVKDLSIGFHMPGRDVQVVNKVNFSLEQGETMAIVGESGSGKTQTAFSLIGLLAKNGYASGSVLFEGQEILGLPEAKLNKVRAEKIAMIFQDPMTSLNPYIRVGEQLVEVLILHKGMNKAAAQAEAIRMLDAVKLPDARNIFTRYPHECSGGMRQRIMIALATFFQPQLILADEPTTALDVVVQKEILLLLMELQEEMGNTIILVSHDMGVHYQVTHRMLIMYAAKAVEYGDSESVFTEPLHPYTRLLISSLPTIGDDRARHGIPGRPPSLWGELHGCRFADRCPLATDTCRAQEPPLVEHQPGHFAACHYAGADLPTARVQ